MGLPFLFRDCLRVNVHRCSDIRMPQ